MENIEGFFLSDIVRGVIDSFIVFSDLDFSGLKGKRKGKLSKDIKYKDNKDKNKVFDKLKKVISNFDSKIEEYEYIILKL